MSLRVTYLSLPLLRPTVAGVGLGERCVRSLSFARVFATWSVGPELRGIADEEFEIRPNTPRMIPYAVIDEGRRAGFKVAEGVMPAVESPAFADDPPTYVHCQIVVCCQSWVPQLVDHLVHENGG